MTSRYPNLFSPMQLGPLEAPNRIWMTAHATQLVKNHNFSEAHVGYYAERAKNGVGVITMEAMAVHPTTQPYEGKVFAYERSVIPQYQKIANACQPHGTLLLGQLWHRGRQTDSIVSRLPVWAPSPVPDTVYRETPHEMSHAEIQELIDGYVVSAQNAIEGGLDGVEIHGIAHGYLIGQFLSPMTNHRTDEYGGSLKNRARMLMEIIARVREVVPSDRICGIRINGDDGDQAGALRNEQWIEIARLISEANALDYISVSQGTYMDRMRIYGATPTPAGFQVADTARIKSVVGPLPVVAVGRISTPEMAESIVASGKADFVGMARQLIADPAWPRKAREDRDQAIRPCVGANWCLSAIVKAPLACIHNPAVGREAELGTGSLSQVAVGRKVAVVGGGPAGLRAALTASRRGHSVTLFEKERELGGQVRLLSVVTSYREWRGITDWLIGQIEQTNVEIRTESCADVESLEGFDDIIVATGATPLMHGWTPEFPLGWNPSHPHVPGVDQWNVLSPVDVLAGGELIGQQVVVYDGIGDRAGVLIAEHLAEKRHSVELVTPLNSIAPELSGSRDNGYVLKRLRRAGVRFATSRQLLSVVEDRLVLRDVHTDEEETRQPVDTVVLATGRAANNELLREASQLGRDNLVGVGDCIAPRRIFNAILEGEEAARAIGSPSTL